MTKIKICGLFRPEDIEYINEAQPDYAGFIVDLPAIGHIWSAWVKETGLVHKRTCSECGAEEEASHNIPSGSVTCTDCGADIIN